MTWWWYDEHIFFFLKIIALAEACQENYAKFSFIIKSKKKIEENYSHVVVCVSDGESLKSLQSVFLSYFFFYFLFS